MSEQAPAKTRLKRFLPFAAVLFVALAGWLWWRFFADGASGGDAAKRTRPVSVSVAPVATRDVEVFLGGLGTVTPLNSVTVKSRVDGQLMRVLFHEGQNVAAGQLLLVIDPRPFQVQLAQYEGQLRRDRALLDNARLDLTRYDELIRQGAIARQQVDTQLSLVKQYEGAVMADRAQAASARLQMTYCRITSPVAGRVGLRQVDPGNMVHASDSTGLVVVNQLSPIAVLFTLPEDQLPQVLAKLRAGEKLRVDAFDRAQARKLAQGELASLDNRIDTGTGTVKLKAVFANRDGALYPNQFVNAKLLLEVLKNAVTVPTAAIQRSQQGVYVFVVAGGVAKTRPVTLGEPGDGVSVVLSGLAPGERVVIDGAERLRDGSAVEVRRPRKTPVATTLSAQVPSGQVPSGQGPSGQAPSAQVFSKRGPSGGAARGLARPAAAQGAKARANARSAQTSARGGVKEQDVAAVRRAVRRPDEGAAKARP